MDNIQIPVPIRVDAAPSSDEEVAETLRKINLHTVEPVTMDEIFTFSGVCSNDRLDSFLTRMDPATTLKNYENDLKRGTPLIDVHDTSKLPYGRSYDGILESSVETADTTNNVRGFWYVLRDLELNGTRTNDTIRAVKAGIIKSMSVGFGGHRQWNRCSSCGKNIYDWECPHIPGLEDENNRMSFAWIVDGELREVSTVYNGATPGAYIDKARSYVQQGQLSKDNIVKLEQRYNVRLDDGKTTIYMPPKREVNNLDILEQVRAALKDNKVEKARLMEVVNEGETFRQADDIAIRNELGEQATPEGIRALKADAEMGRQYAADLIDEAVKARVRASGDSFNVETYKNVLIRSNDVAFIKDEIKSYESLAKTRFVGGRQTEQEQLDNEQPQTRAVAVDENIFG